MAINLRGRTFSGFWDEDYDALGTLDFRGQAEWLEYRFRLVLLQPLELLEVHESQAYVWFAIVQMICVGVETLAKFEFRGHDDAAFEKFVCKYFGSPVWRDRALYTKVPEAEQAISPARVLYKYFRNGLAHGLRIQWGTLLHTEDGGPEYADVRDLNGVKQRVLCIAPRPLLADFKSAERRFFRELITSPLPRRRYFMERFERIRSTPWR